MDQLDSFGEWMRQRRDGLRLTRPELAECAGCSVSALRKIEADERRPSRQLAELLAGCLRIPSEEQPVFVDAARGARRVARLGSPTPRLTPLPPPTVTVTAAATDTYLPPGPNWNLPAPAMPLVGREAELVSLGQLLSDPDCRLLTLVGPGGIGKTRLALETARLQWDSFAGGVFFVSLVSVSSPEHLVPAVAQAVGLNFAGPAEPRMQLINYLRNKQLLLLLDNLEHLLDGVDLVAEMLDGALGLKLLTTSRERLELQAEWVFEVQGLPVPAEGQVEELEKHSAIQLFLQRARQEQVDFKLAVENCPDVVRICRLVEGMPLAIELAAAWVPVLSCAEIADEIERSIDFLTTTARDVPERQRSMRAVFDHSWRLLSEDEQQALCRMSVFRGGFSRQAAQVVAGASLPLLSALLAKSFLRRTSEGRYDLHELVRQYVADRLTEKPDEEQTARDRHSSYYTDLVAELEERLKGAEQLEALAKMDVEVDNIRAGWRWAARRGQWTAVQKPVRAMWYFYDIRGWFQEAETSFAWMAEEVGRCLPSAGESDAAVSILCAYAHAQQGWFCLRNGDFEESDRLLRSSLDVLRSAGAYRELVDALQHAGALDRLMGQYARSRVRFEEMLQFALQTDDPWNATIAEGNIGLAAQALGGYEEAQERMMSTVNSFRSLGDRRMLGVALHFLGGTTCTLCSYDQARAYLQESLALSHSLGDRWIESMTLCELGRVAQETGGDAEAASMYRESLSLAREIGEHWSMLQALNGLGTASLSLSDFATANSAFSEALTTAWAMHAQPDVLAALGGLARLSVRQGSGEETLRAALRTALFVLDHLAATEQTKEVARQLRAEMEARLEPVQVAAEQTSAKNLSLEAFVASVLEQVSA